MSVDIWIGKDYHNTHEHAMAASVIRLLKDALKGTASPFHILCNLSVPDRDPRSRFRSEIDMAVLRPGSLTVIELKNYQGSLDYSESAPWLCHTEDGKTIEVKGGYADRTPFGQVRDYRENLIALLERSRAAYLSPDRPADRNVDPRPFVSCRVVFADCTHPPADRNGFEGKTRHWVKVIRRHELPESLCQADCGWRMTLAESELLKLIEGPFGLRRAEMIGDTPMVRASEHPRPPAQPTPPKIVYIPEIRERIVTRTVEKTVPVETVRYIGSEYGAIDSVLRSEESFAEKILQLWRLLRQQTAAEARRRFSGSTMTPAAAINELFRDRPDLRLRVNRLRILTARTHRETEHGADRASVGAASVRESVKTLCLLTARFTGDPIPAGLQAVCDTVPDRPPEPPRPREPGETVRLLVTAVDPRSGTLQGYDTESEDEEPPTLTVLYNDPERPEFALLHKHVRPGDTLLLVTPLKPPSGPWKASAFVLWPDFLISPESLGESLEFAHSGVHYWLQALADDPPQANSQGLRLGAYTLRGNFASRCLADDVCGIGEDADAALSRYCREHTPELLRTFGPEGAVSPPENWLALCRDCHANIRTEITRRIPADYPDTRGGIWQIEAPLFSPVYGLSARVDALMLRYGPKGPERATVFELKSGKWAPYPRPAPREKHRIQPRFYGDILDFAFGIRRENVRALLYYASTHRPRNGLPTEGCEFNEVTASADIRRYTQVRNTVLAVADAIRRGTFRDALARYTADTFCPRRDRRTGAPDWGSPDHSPRNGLERILNVLRSGDPLAQAYYFRFLAFLAAEDFESRLGNGRDPDALPPWRCSAAHRREEGRMMSDLTPVPEGGITTDAAGRITAMRLDTTHNPCNRICSIRVGDSVCLYDQRDGEADIAHAVIVLVTVRAFGNGTVDVTFDHPQHAGLPGFAGAAAYAMEPQPPSFSRNAYRNLWHVLTGIPRRRDIVLGRALPEADPPGPDDPPADAPGHAGLVAAVRRAHDLFLLWGPPGTGKTSHAMRALVDAARAAGQTVLLSAYTYRAADEICAMLEARGEPYLCLGTPERYGETARKHALIGEATAGLTAEEQTERIQAASLFVGVVAGLRPDHPLFALKRIDLAVIDEASQLLDHHLTALFCGTDRNDPSRPLIGKMVLIGDDLQLPAVVTQSPEKALIEDPLLRGQGFVSCAESFFARIRRKIGDGSPCFGKLLRHFRMHPTIAAFCNLFYRELIPGGAPHQTRGLPGLPDGLSPLAAHVLSHRLAFVAVPPERNGLMSKSSLAEAAACARVAAAFRDFRSFAGKARFEPGDLGIVVPFRSQIATVREALAAHPALGEAFASGTLIDTVERFQGATRHVVLFTTVIRTPLQAPMISAEPRTVRSDSGEPPPIDRKLNVAVTRAKEHFILIGNESALRGLRCYGELLEWIGNPDSRPPWAHSPDDAADGGIYREVPDAPDTPTP